MSDIHSNVLVFHSPSGGAGQTAVSAHVAIGLARSGRNVVLLELLTPSAAAPYLAAADAPDPLPVPVALGSLSAVADQAQDRLWHVALDGDSSEGRGELRRLVSGNASRGLWVVIDLPRHLDARRDLGIEPDLEVCVLRADPAVLVDPDRLAGLDPAVRLVLNQIDQRRPISLAIDRVLGALLDDRLVARIHYDEAVPESLASCSSVFDFAPGSSAAGTFYELVNLMIASERSEQPIVASRTVE